MRFFIAAVTTFLLVSAAHADPSKTDSAIFRIVFATAEPPAVAQRKQLASALVDFWRDFSSKVPRNSPSATEWLLRELNTTDAMRIGRAVATPEYALRELSELADGCLSDSELAQASVGSDPLRELYAWIRVTGCYGNPLATEQRMKTAGLSKGLFDGPLTMAHATALHSFLTGKLANAVVGGK